MSNVKKNISQLTEEDFIKAFELFEVEGKNFPASISYDISWQGNNYPPKPIIALAYKNHYGEYIKTTDFGQGKDSNEFKLIEKLGFEIVEKKPVISFRVSLYDVHGESAVTNYNTLISYDKKLFLWNDKKFNKIQINDYIFWVNRQKKEAIATKVISKQVLPHFENGKCFVEYKDFSGFALADSKDKYKNFFAFEIISIVQLEDNWNYLDSTTFQWQAMFINLLTEDVQQKDIPKKIEKLNDLIQPFLLQEEVISILNYCIEYLESKLKPTITPNLKFNFTDFLTKFDSIEIESYIELIRKIINNFQINIRDQRFVYNYDDEGFYFTVGQRYCLVYTPKSNEAKFFIASSEKIGNLDKDTQFDGPPLVYFSRRNELLLKDIELSKVYDAVKVEISRSKKSRYYKSNKQDFENYVFDGLVSTSIINYNFIEDFIKASSSQNLFFSSYLTKRYIASLATKPFVIFTGLSGSGKTKLAQTFAQWICEEESQYKIIPVGADWTNREPLLGYPNSLDSKNYVLPDNGALELMLNAIKNASENTVEGELNVSACKPFFLILDEMNLSHVERYFADFLSAMESKEIISLYTGEVRKDQIGNNIPQRIVLPPNLFVVGTVNIDETTYMFSPKVLDRANTIEFRVDSKEMKNFFAQQSQKNSDTLSGQGSEYKDFFMQLVSNSYPKTNKHQSALIAFFRELQALGAEFGYRTANEMINLMQRLEELGVDSSKNENELDVAVMQKLLPKLHGSRTKLVKTLPLLASFCIKGTKLEDAKIHLDSFKNNRLLTTEQEKQLLLPLSFYKIARMYANALENGFASYAEG
jgi:5-methylcytosine-specific restriction protein B